MTEKDNAAVAALLTRAKEIKRGSREFVVVAKATFQAMEGLAWLASDPERYNSVVDMHLKVQSFEENAHLFSDTFPPMKRGSRS